MITLEQAQVAKIKVKRLLAGAAEVAGIGVTRVGDDYAVKVNLSAPGAEIPDNIDGVPVRVEVTGSPKAGL